MWMSTSSLESEEADMINAIKAFFETIWILMRIVYHSIKKDPMANLVVPVTVTIIVTVLLNWLKC